MTDPLLTRLQTFSIDLPGVDLPFATRLARENGWRRAFAERVVAEYRRFLWLAVRAGHAVTPSGAVDEAWHLHLCYSRSYWNDLCANVLGRPLHHGPTQGGGAEDARYRQQYEATLASYRRHFGGEPPHDIWPSATERFAPARVTKVDRRTHWVITKPGRRAAAATAVVLTAVVVSACSGEPASNETFFVTLAVGLLVAVIAFVIFGGKRANSRGSDGGTTACGSACGTGSRHHRVEDHDEGHTHGDGHGNDGGGGGGGGGGESGGGGGCGSSGCGGGGD